jgi:hypothetical protein
MGGLKNIVGGQIGAYTEMCEQAREHAYSLMLRHAKELGANPVVGLRYDASEVVSTGSATEVLCYGTAVVIGEEISDEEKRERANKNLQKLTNPKQEGQAPEILKSLVK